MQTSIKHKRIHRFKSLLKYGNKYSASQFEVVPIYNYYKITNNQFLIVFTDATQIVEVPDDTISTRKKI